jgi:hypothetical protein
MARLGPYKQKNNSQLDTSIVSDHFALDMPQRGPHLIHVGHSAPTHQGPRPDPHRFQRAFGDLFA